MDPSPCHGYGRLGGARELRDDGGPRGGAVPRGCPRHLSTRRAVSGPDLRRAAVDRTCIPPRPRTFGEADLSLPGQPILNRIRLRRLIKGVSLFLSLSLPPSPRGYSSRFPCRCCCGPARRAGRHPRSRGKGNSGGGGRSTITRIRSRILQD